MVKQPQSHVCQCGADQDRSGLEGRQDRGGGGSGWIGYLYLLTFSMTIGLVGIWLFSILDNSARAKIDRAGFVAQQVRSETGIGADGASGH